MCNENHDFLFRALDYLVNNVGINTTNPNKMRNNTF
jgi:hypothetical protein